MMNNVVSINRRKVLGAYIDAQAGGLANEDAYFCAGVLSSLVMPQYVLFVYGGSLALIAFAVTGLIGLALGVAKYYWLPYRPHSGFDWEADSHLSSRAFFQNRKAA